VGCGGGVGGGGGGWGYSRLSTSESGTKPWTTKAKGKKTRRRDFIFPNSKEREINKYLFKKIKIQKFLYEFKFSSFR